jgi:hypothetical protein
MMKNEIEKLKERVKELKGKVKKLKEELREGIENEELHENMIEMCEEECLHNDVEEFELVFLPIFDNFKLCLLDPKKVKYMIRLSLTEFSDFVNKVAPSISCLTWRGEFRINTKITPINFPINHGIFLTLFWFVHYPTLSLLSCFFSLHLQTISAILRRFVNGIANALRNEIQWLTPQ